jgi:hypothetical protein
MATTIKIHDNYEWTFGGLFLSFLTGVVAVAGLWLFAGLLIGLFMV